VHVAAAARCRPVTWLTRPGHRHDSVAFEVVLASIRMALHGAGRPRTRPDRVMADKAHEIK
jgi:hypothetical protein